MRFVVVIFILCAAQLCHADDVFNGLYHSGDANFRCGVMPLELRSDPNVRFHDVGYRCDTMQLLGSVVMVRSCRPVAFHGEHVVQSATISTAIESWRRRAASKATATHILTPSGTFSCLALSGIRS